MSPVLCEIGVLVNMTPIAEGVGVMGGAFGVLAWTFLRLFGVVGALNIVSSAPFVPVSTSVAIPSVAGDVVSAGTIGLVFLTRFFGANVGSSVLILIVESLSACNLADLRVVIVASRKPGRRRQ